MLSNENKNETNTKIPSEICQQYKTILGQCPMKEEETTTFCQILKETIEKKCAK